MWSNSNFSLQLTQSDEDSDEGNPFALKNRKF